MLYETVNKAKGKLNMLMAASAKLEVHQGFSTIDKIDFNESHLHAAEDFLSH